MASSVRCEFPSPQCNAEATEAWEKCEGNRVVGRTVRCVDHRPQGAEWVYSEMGYMPPYDTESWPAGPMVTDGKTARFRENKIVSYLLDQFPGGNLNELTVMVMQGKFSAADYSHLMQLIGYSLSGFSELSTTTDAVYFQAELKAEAMIACQPREEPNAV